MTLNEAMANRHLMHSSKFERRLANDPDDMIRNMFVEKGWMSNDTEVLKLFEEGSEQFWANTAERIVRDNPGKIYFNLCSKCGKLARTPQAKQCRYCGYNWHKRVVATFQIASAFEVTGRAFVILGDLLTGQVKIGQRADLTILGLGVKPIITSIEFARINMDGVVWEDIGLMLSEVSEDDKEYLRSKSPFSAPIFIEDETVS